MRWRGGGFAYHTHIHTHHASERERALHQSIPTRTHTKSCWRTSLVRREISAWTSALRSNFCRCSSLSSSQGMASNCHVFMCGGLMMDQSEGGYQAITDRSDRIALTQSTESNRIESHPLPPTTPTHLNDARQLPVQVGQPLVGVLGRLRARLPPAPPPAGPPTVAPTAPTTATAAPAAVATALVPRPPPALALDVERRRRAATAAASAERRPVQRDCCGGRRRRGYRGRGRHEKAQGPRHRHGPQHHQEHEAQALPLVS